MRSKNLKNRGLRQGLRLAAHRLACRLLGHRWKTVDQEKVLWAWKWRYCTRCGTATLTLLSPDSERPKDRCVLRI